MNRWLIWMAGVLWTLGMAAQQDTLKFRILLRDKAATVYSLGQPRQFLSDKSLQRRARQHLPVDSTDLPVCDAYVEAIVRQGVRVVAKGRWENFVTVACNDTACISRIAALPFVRSIERVWRAPEWTWTARREPLLDEPDHYEGSFYGAAEAQIRMNNGHLLHQAGFRGEGMTIAVIDAGFHNADTIAVMKNIRILGVKDFVNPQGDPYVESTHGLKVLSCLAMNTPEVMVGTAPEASFWLLRSEDEQSEHLVEQDYWAAAVEFADSVGVDVVNTSLGYYAFDDTLCNYRFAHLDGRHALMSREAARMADKGMLLVCSAGNQGAGPWKKMTPPADADGILSVGAVDRQGILAPFSSIGPTADGRIKPDVVAMGKESAFISPDGCQATGDGTSFASPILCGMAACLWQACPTLTARELMELIRRSGDRADNPDTCYGHGVPDMWKAYQTYLSNMKR